MQRYLTINQAAEALSIHPNTIRNHLQEFGAVDLHNGRSQNRLLRIPEAVIDGILRDGAIRMRKGGKQKTADGRNASGRGRRIG